MGRKVVPHDSNSDLPLMTIKYFSPDKLEKDSPAYKKYKNSKRFDPAKSDVMKVLNQQKDGNFSVDKAAIKEIWMYGGEGDESQYQINITNQ